MTTTLVTGATGTPGAPGKLFVAYRAGSALVPGPAEGRQSFADHLAARVVALR